MTRNSSRAIPTCIVGVSAYYHDSAACLVRDGDIVAAAQEERFTRKKHDPGFPHRAIDYCLKAGGIGLKDIDHLVFYDKPLVKFERLLETYLAFAPMGIQSFLAAMPVWMKEKLFLKSLLRDEFLKHGEGMTKKELPPILFSEHHESHAASAFYPSPYDSAVVLCMDGVGEWANNLSLAGRRQQVHPFVGNPFSPLAWAPVLSVHILHWIQGQFR